MRSVLLTFKLAGFLLLLALVHPILGQDKNTRITIKALQIWSNQGSDGEDQFEYRYNTWFNGTLNSNCIGFDNVAPNVWHDVLSHDQIRVSGYFGNMDGSYALDVEAWEEDGSGGDCGYNTSGSSADENQCARHLTATIMPYNLVPGEYTGSPNVFTSNMCNGKYYITFQVIYTPPKPDVPTIRCTRPSDSDATYINYGGENVCDKSKFELSTGIYVHPSNVPYVYYTWEYWDGVSQDWIPNPNYCGGSSQCEYDPTIPNWQPPTCCYQEPATIPVPKWKTITQTHAGTNGGKLVIDDIRSLDGLTNVQHNRDIAFRVIATANGTSSVYSDAKTVRISPAPPVFSSANITTSVSCSLKGTGAITVTGITGLGTYKYALKPGSDTEPCNPALGNCNTAVNSDTDISGSAETIVEIPANTYVLLIANPGDTKGVCYATQPVTVSAISEISITYFDPDDYVCYDMNKSGKITFTVSGGDESKRAFQLFKPADKFTGPLTLTSPAYDGSSGQYSFSSLSLGDYGLTVSDDGCSQQKTQSATIRRPSKVLIDPDSPPEFAPATCTNPPNGFVKIDVVKPVDDFETPLSSSFHYRLTENPSVYTATTTAQQWVRGDVSPGSYTLVVTEVGGAVCNGVSHAITINPPAPLVVSSLVTHDAKCYDSLNGSFTFNATGGTNNLRYGLQKTTGESYPVSSVPEFKKLGAGFYKLRVSQASCSDFLDYTPSIEIKQPTLIQIAVSETDITCYEYNDGIIRVDGITGGTRSPQAPFYNSFIWEKYDSAAHPAQQRWITQSPDFTLTGRPPGAYRFRLKDANACPMTSDTLLVTQPPLLEVVSVLPQDIICKGELGNILMTAKGGTPDYTFYQSKDLGLSYEQLTSVRTLTSGQYLVKVRDNHGCEAVSDFDEFETNEFYTITEPPIALDFDYVQSDYNGFNISCQGFYTGHITLNSIGGNGTRYDGTPYEGYSYSIDADVFTGSNYFDSLNVGFYDLHIQDARGCIVTKNIEFTEPEILVPKLISKTDVFCFGDSTGRIQVEGLGGVQPYIYKLDTASFKPSGIFEALPANKYSITIRDKNECVTILPLLIQNANPALSVSHQVRNVACHGGHDGEIEITPNGGAGNFTYLIDGNMVANPIRNLSSGTYSVRVIDKDGCGVTLEDIAIAQPDLLIISEASFTDIRCLGESGKIQVQAEGGIAPYRYEYALGNTFTYNTFTNSTDFNAGTYRIRAVDAHGCVGQYPNTFVISQPPSALDFNYVQSDYNGFNISCHGGYNGHVTLTASGGNGGAYTGYTYAIDAEPFQSLNKIEGIYAGDHVIHVKDARGCVREKTVSFSQSAELITAAILRQADVNCVEDANGELEITASGGASPYQYRLENGTFQQSNIITQLHPGEYTVVVADRNGCAVHIPAKINALNPAVALSSSVRDVRCFDGNDGAIEVSIVSGTSPFSYRWSNINATSNAISGLKEGTYDLHIIDQAGCKKDTTFVIRQPDAQLAMTATALAACYGQNNGTVDIVARGGTAPYQYSYNNGGSYQNEERFSIAAGVYILKVRDANGCTTTSNINVGQRNLTPEPNFMAATVRNALDTLVLTDISVPQPDSIHWTIDSKALILENNGASPVINCPNEGTYTISMEAFFGGCGYVVTKDITLNPFDPEAIKESLPGYKPIEEVNVTPNPSTGVINVSVKLNKKYDVVLGVYDMMGSRHYYSILKQQQEFSETIDLGNVAAGIYLVRVITERDAEEVRISVQ